VVIRFIVICMSTLHAGLEECKLPTLLSMQLHCCLVGWSRLYIVAKQLDGSALGMGVDIVKVALC